MSHLRALRDELFKYRKRKKGSIDGTVPGVPYQRYRRSTTPALGSRPRGSGGYHHDDYLDDIPSKYRPNMFSPAVDWDEYRQDHDEFTPILKTPQDRRQLDDIFPENPMPVASSDEMSLTEQWLMNMGVRPRHQEGPVEGDIEDIRHLLDGVHVPLHAIGSHLDINSQEAIPFPDGIHTRLNSPETEHPQLLPDLDHITEALNILQTRLPEDHPDILNLRQAQKQLAWQQIEEFQQDPTFQEKYQADDGWQSNLGPTGNPYEDNHIVQMEMELATQEEDHFAPIEDVVQEPMVQDEWVPHYDDCLIQDVDQPFFEEPMPDQMAEADGFQPKPMLEEMVEQEFMVLEATEAGMAMPDVVPGSEMGPVDNTQPEHFMGLEVFDVEPAFDEINQAMDQAAAFEPPEMDPWKQQMDPYQQMSMMMDMQYMADPFMMPGQMGPGYGPMPGPM